MIQNVCQLYYYFLATFKHFLRMREHPVQKYTSLAIAYVKYKNSWKNLFQVTKYVKTFPDDIFEGSKIIWSYWLMNFKQVVWRCEKSISLTSSLNLKYHKIATWMSLFSTLQKFSSLKVGLFWEAKLYLANKFTVSHFGISSSYSWISFAVHLTWLKHGI